MQDTANTQPIHEQKKKMREELNVIEGVTIQECSAHWNILIHPFTDAKTPICAKSPMRMGWRFYVCFASNTHSFRSLPTSLPSLPPSLQCRAEFRDFILKRTKSNIAEAPNIRIFGALPLERLSRK